MMRRSCVIPKVNGGKPFCAYMSFVELDHNGEFWEVLIDIESSSYRHMYAVADTEEKANAIVRILEWQLAQDLNPPIKVSRLVLDAMEKVPEASFWYVEGSVNVRLKWDDTLKTFTVNGQTLSITDYIQADCPLALQVLLQFNTEGELVDV